MNYEREIHEAINRPPFDTTQHERDWDYSPTEEEDQEEADVLVV